MGSSHHTMKIMLGFALFWVNGLEQRVFLRQIVLWRNMSTIDRAKYRSPPEFRYVWRVRWVLAWAMVMTETPLLLAGSMLSSLLFGVIMLVRWLS